MTEIEKVKGEIKVLEAKLALLEEMENYKTPAEEAYKNTYGNYPMGEPFWIVFKKGYEAAQSTKEDTVWKSVALKFGRKLPVIIPYGYDELSPNAWFRWVVFIYDNYMNQRDKESGYCPTPQSPEQVEEGLRDAMIQAKKDGVFDND